MNFVLAFFLSRSQIRASQLIDQYKYKTQSISTMDTELNILDSIQLVVSEENQWKFSRLGVDEESLLNYENDNEAGLTNPIVMFINRERDI